MMQNQYYRTFIGIPVHVGDAFLSAREELIAALNMERISWVDPERYHVTLRFIGETERRQVDIIGNILRERLSVPGITEYGISNPGLFGPEKKPRVVWVGFKENNIFSQLRKSVEQVLYECGLPKLEQPFRAHLTLGRIRSVRDLSHLYNTMEQFRDRFYGSVVLDRVVFYRSELLPDGPVYTPLEEVFFGD